MKKVLIISASPRKDGNSDLLAQAFAKGAKEAGNEVTTVRLAEKKINYCLACYYCADHNGHCIQKDDAEAIVNQMKEADVIVFATPTYFYSMAGQLKVFIDRTVKDYLSIKDKTFYYLITSWDPEPKHIEKVVESIRGFTLDCCEGAIEGGILLATNVTKKGEIVSSDYLQKAQKMGKNI